MPSSSRKPFLVPSTIPASIPIFIRDKAFRSWLWFLSLPFVSLPFYLAKDQPRAKAAPFPISVYPRDPRYGFAFDFVYGFAPGNNQKPKAVLVQSAFIRADPRYDFLILRFWIFADY